VASLNLLANTLLAQGNTEAGLDILAKLAEMQPDSPVALGRLGAGQLMAGQRSSGVESLEAALAIDPQFEQAEILVVLNYLQEKEYEKAVASAEAFRDRNPDSAQPLNLLGRVYLVTGQVDKARQGYLDALRIDPAYGKARLCRGEVPLRRGVG
jgi:tetratricopeptide (TPR) repeat protein